MATHKSHNTNIRHTEKGVSFFILKNKEVTRYEAIEKAPFHIPCNDDLYAGNRHNFTNIVSAAAEEMTAYMIDIPRSIDPQKTGWGTPSIENVWEVGLLMKGTTIQSMLRTALKAD